MIPCLLSLSSPQKTHSKISTKSGKILYLLQLTFYVPNSNQVLLDLVEGQDMESGVDNGKKVD